MTPKDVWDVVNNVVTHVTGLEVIEAFDKRPASERPQAPYIALSLHKISPAAMATTSSKRFDDYLEVTHHAPSEIELRATIHRVSEAMDKSFSMHSITVNEQAKIELFKAEMSVWRIVDHDRDPKEVNQSYEDSATASIFVAADLTTTEKIGFADKVEFSVNGLDGEAVQDKTTKG